MSGDNSKRLTVRVSAVSVIFNLILTVFKLLAGIFASSAALIADAVHSASDIFGSLIVIVGAAVSHKAADEAHPYGHEKLECIASFILGCILAAVGAGIGLSGIRTIISGAEIAVPGRLALIAAAVSVAVKEGLYRYTVAAAKKIGSVSLRAEAWHHRSDALSSVGSLLGVVGARLGLPILDPIAAIVICIFIFRVAYSIFKESIDRLVDRSCDEAEIREMRIALSQVDGVLGVDDIKTRLFGNRVYVDVEICADGDMRLTDAHAIAEAAHRRLEADFPDVKHCTVHINPARPE